MLHGYRSVVWALLAAPLVFGSQAGAAPVGVFEDARDIGAPPAAGSTSFDGSTYTLRGSGADIWDGGDQCHFAYKTLRGDFEMTIRVTRRDTLPAGSGQWGRNGLMARASLDPDSKHSLVATLLPTADGPGSGVWHPPFHQFRFFDRQAAPCANHDWVREEHFPSDGRSPAWMRLSRVGNAIHSYLAEDADGNGQPDRWVLAGSDSSPSLPRALLVGPYLHSQAGTNLGTITFDSVTIIENRRVPPVMDCSVGQTLLSKTYDTGDPGALSDAFVVLRSGALRPAVVSPGRLRITGEGGDLATAVWYDIPGSDRLPQGGFIAELDVFLSPPGDADAADGLTLAFIERGAEILGPPGAPDLCGAPGGSLGYGGGTILERIDGHPSFAVEIDNWIGGGAPGNEPFDGGIQAGVGRYHVGLDLNGEVSSVQTNLDAGVPSHLLPDLFRPEGVHLYVQYFPDGTVDAYVSSNRAPFTMYHVISHRVPRLQGPVLLGITGGTGGAWCTREIDNFRVRLTSCSPGAESGIRPVPIDLGNVTAGGDGDLYSPAPYVGVDPRNGRFASDYLPVLLYNNWPPDDPAQDGINPSPGDGPYIDSAFFLTNRQSGEFFFPQDITMSRVQYKFPEYDAVAQGFNHILANRVGGVSSPGIAVGSRSGYWTSVGMHSALGITYDLDALRARHGWRNVRHFSTQWGLDECAGGDADLIAVLSSDAGVMAERIERFRSREMNPISMPIPANARYLTLATGSQGGDLNCDHGTFARAIITSIDHRDEGAASWIWRHEPPLVSTGGGQRVTIRGDNLNTRDGYEIGGKPATGLIQLPGAGGPEGGVSAIQPALAPGYHDIEVRNLDDDNTGSIILKDAFEAAPPPEITAVEPEEVLADRPNLITVHGRNFRGVTRFEIRGAGGEVYVIGPTEASDTRITGSVPAQAAGVKDVVATDTRGTAVLAGGIAFVDSSSIAITGVEPNLISTGGGSQVTFRGRGFSQGVMTPRLGGQALAGVTFVSAAELRGRAPALSAGRHAAELIGPVGEVFSSLPNAVEAAAPPTLTAFEPRDILIDGSTAVTVRGTGLRDVTRIRIGTRDLLSPVVAADGRSITGRAPPLPAGETAGVRDVTAVDPRGDVTLAGAARYVAPPLATLSSVSPALVLTGGGTVVTFTGTGFRAGVHSIRVGGRPLVSPTLLDATRIRGATQALAAGFHDVEVIGAGGIVEARRQGAIEAAPPVAVTALVPRDLPFDRSTRVQVRGANFRPATIIRIGTRDLLEPVLSGDGTIIEGLAPPMPAGETLGPRDVVAVDPRGNATLASGARYVTPPSPGALPPGPQEIEGTLAAGTARFLWFNPVAYREIRVLSELGQTVDTLAGDARSTLIPAPGERRVRIGLQGVLPDGRTTAISDAFASIYACERPPPVTGNDERGELNLAIRGGYADNPPPRCVEGVGAGEDHVHAAQGSGGSLLASSRGHVVSAAVRLGNLQQANVLTTGFVLERDADKLEISGYYQKVAADFGLSLRGRLRRVHPQADLDDEFTFPDVLIDVADKSWNPVTYFRATTDVGGGGVPRRCPGNPRILAGEYLLDLYAVGGTPDLPYYLFEDDGRPDDLLIPGAPCPPYPRVRIIDVTGFVTPPVFDPVLEWEKVSESSNGPVTLRLTATGYWSDEGGFTHPIDPRDPDFIENSFEYCWAVRTRELPECKPSQGNSIEITVPSYGCYKIEVTALDRACGVMSRKGYEIAVIPDVPACSTVPLTFSHVAPDPRSIFALAGLDPPPGHGKFHGTRPFELRFLATPCACGPGAASILGCPAPFYTDQRKDFALRLAARAPGGDLPLSGVEMLVTDECIDVTAGPKYFSVRIEDLGKIPSIPGSNGHRFSSIHLQARANVGGAPWVDVGPPFNMANRPEALARSYWTGLYDAATDTYSFTMRSTQGDVARMPMAPTNEIPFSIPGFTDIRLPSLDNGMSSGLSSTITCVSGHWDSGASSGILGGTVLGNGVDGEPHLVRARSLGGGGAADGAGGIVELPPAYEWSDDRELVRENFSQTLVNAVIYHGPLVPPVFVTIRALIELGIEVTMNSAIRVKVAPFQALAGESNLVDSHVYICSRLSVHLPCSIRADIFFGIASVAVGLEPETEGRLNVHVGASDDGLDAGAELDIDFNLKFFLEACLLFACERIFEDYVVERVKLAESRFGNTNFTTPSGCADGGGGGLRVPVEAYQLVTVPATAVSPDGRSTLDVWTASNGRNVIRMNDGDLPLPPQDFNLHWRDPSAAFVNNNMALVAWTSDARAADALSVDPSIQLTEAGLENLTLAQRSLLESQKEVVVTVLPSVSAGTVLASVPIADLGEAVPQAVQLRHADGRAALAADTAHGEATVAWVRYETPNFILQQGTSRVQIDDTGIYARKLTFAGGALRLGTMRKISVDGPGGRGIHIEPAIDYSPTGDQAYCVWVNDPIHQDLVADNTGRQLLVSIYSRASDSWSAPRPVLSRPEDYPGLLEPHVALTGNGHGLVAFTALDGQSPHYDIRDTGMGGTGREVYACRLEGGTFGEPIRIHGQCKERVYGHWVRITKPVPQFIDPSFRYFIANPELLVSFQRTGMVGSQAGAGAVVAAAFGSGMTIPSAPVSVVDDENGHTNFAAVAQGGALRVVNLNLGPSLLATAGGGAGVGGAPGFQVTESPLYPDLAIAGCRLGDAFPSPGVTVTASIDVENLGLADAPVTQTGQPVVGLRALFIDDSGESTLAAEAPLDVLGPGSRSTVEIELEMPHDPVRLRIELHPNPIDRDPANDIRECWFGAPPPRDVSCQAIALPDETESPAALVTWSNPALYDEVMVYRDGSMLVSLPGSATSFVDSTAAPAMRVYEVRGRIGASKSTRSAAACGGGQGFFRGDADGTGGLDITDAIFTLNFLFSGGAEPPCSKAADTDDSGSLDITDPIVTLGYLFLGNRPPASPHPNCGGDPTPDGLPCPDPHGCP